MYCILHLKAKYVFNLSVDFRQSTVSESTFIWHLREFFSSLDTVQWSQLFDGGGVGWRVNNQTQDLVQEEQTLQHWTTPQCIKKQRAKTNKQKTTTNKENQIKQTKMNLHSLNIIS